MQWDVILMRSLLSEGKSKKGCVPAPDALSCRLIMCSAPAELTGPCSTIFVETNKVGLLSEASSADHKLILSD